MFGPHTFDLMAADSNVMKDRDGNSLPHFTRTFSLESAGVNLFAQDISGQLNSYVFPPVCLISVVLQFFSGTVAPLCCFP